jgi:hypothetical protein
MSGASIIPRPLRSLLLAAALLIAAPSRAQPAEGSPEQLRQQIDRLVTRNEELVTRLSEQTKQIDRLAGEKRELSLQIERLGTEVQRLKSELDAKAPPAAAPPTTNLRASQPPTSKPDEPRATTPDDPLASPASMLAGLVKAHADGFVGWVHETPAEAERYALAVEDWCERLPRVWRGERTWVLRLSDWRRDAYGPASVRMRVIDPATDLPIGEPFRREFPRSYIDRLERQESSRARPSPLAGVPNSW